MPPNVWLKMDTAMDADESQDYVVYGDLEDASNQRVGRLAHLLFKLTLW